MRWTGDNPQPRNSYSCWTCHHTRCWNAEASSRGCPDLTAWLSSSQVSAEEWHFLSRVRRGGLRTPVCSVSEAQGSRWMTAGLGDPVRSGSCSERVWGHPSTVRIPARSIQTWWRHGLYRGPWPLQQEHTHTQWFGSAPHTLAQQQAAIRRWSCPCTHYEGIWGRGGIAPLIIYLGTWWGWVGPPEQVWPLRIGKYLAAVGMQTPVRPAGSPVTTPTALPRLQLVAQLTDSTLNLLRVQSDQCCLENNRLYSQVKVKVKGKAIPLQAWTGPSGSRRLRLPDF